MQVQVRVRDVPYEEMAAEHDFAFSRGARKRWKSLRGKLVTIETPAIEGDGLCQISGRFFKIVEPREFPSCPGPIIVCEHQLELGD